MKIVEYTSKEASLWDNFIKESVNGTVFHLQKFLAYHRPGRFNHRHLLFYKKGKLIAVVPGVDWHKGQLHSYISHKGASYGGFVLREGVGIADALELVSTLIWWCNNKKFDRIYLTQPPEIYYARPDNHIDFALYKAGFTFAKRELTSVIELKSSIDGNFNLFKPEARTATRKAIKSGLEVRISEDWDEFYPIKRFVSLNSMYIQSVYQVC